MIAKKTVTVNGREVPIQGERNLLELIRAAGIEVPTFCYHSELSIYGACRLCLVDVEGRGIQSSCSITPEDGMVIRTHTPEIREMRKLTLELLLADGHQNCTACPKNGSCQLQDLARQLGVRDVRFKPTRKEVEIDDTCGALVRDPNKCVLCGDCVRFCHEVQDIGAIDFAHRGAQATVCPAHNETLDKVECVHCGQCARVCPTGAITPANEIDKVWGQLDDQDTFVVVQIAPAVRVALGEHFGLEPGAATTGQMVAALKAMGFDRVFDTSFAADLTVIEEAEEFIRRKTAGEDLPLMTSCCPAWVRFAEQYYPDQLNHLSTCRSPQQMFGVLARKLLPETCGIKPENLKIVSIMPCTAKKTEAGLEKFRTELGPDVDYVLTTQELGRMIEQAGVQFNQLNPESMDLPMGFKTGAGVIFGNSGGVSEAVLRYAGEKLTGVKLQAVQFDAVRGEGGLREAKVKLGDTELKLAVVHGLRVAKQLMEKIAAGTCDYDLIEVMSCPNGCIGGAGQPISKDRQANQRRAEGLYGADQTLQLHKAQENPYIQDLYDDLLGEPGKGQAHHLLHTGYQSRKRVHDAPIELTGPKTAETALDVSVCVGTGCYVRGAQTLLNTLIRRVEEMGLENDVAIRAAFCTETCDKGPNVRVGENQLTGATVEASLEAIQQQLAGQTK